MLSVLQRKKGSSGFKKGGNSKDCFKTIGVANVPLHEVADGQVHDLELPLNWCVSESATIHVAISATERDNVSETSSVQDNDSVADDASVVSASEYSAASTASVQRASAPQPSTVPLKLFPTRSGRPPAAAPQPAGIPPTISEELDHGADMRTAYDSKWDSETSSQPTQRLTPTALKMHSTSSVGGGAAGSGSVSVASASKLQEMQKTIDQLEAAVLASEEIVQYERNRCKEALQRAVRDIGNNKYSEIPILTVFFGLCFVLFLWLCYVRVTQRGPWQRRISWWRRTDSSRPKSAAS